MSKQKRKAKVGINSEEYQGSLLRRVLFGRSSQTPIDLNSGVLVYVDLISSALDSVDLVINLTELVFYGEKMQCSDSSGKDQKFQVRRLELSDKNKGFIELLQQLTVCDSVTDKDFQDRFQELSSLGDDHVICVIEDDQSGKIIATGSVFIEKKFIRNCGKVGHVEDVVVDSNARGLQLGKKIVGFLTDHAQSVGCYKMILDCSDENRTFYEKCGFKQKEIQMVKYFL
ncbi:FkbH domain containing protein [Parasponia andersonii]|uniref:Glucosamine 6-phosphate N-acetyltransferase n=1 Tax=Parasponia andersonii TaxID=3476 RepID=A0A2P5B0X1_PARAD|nr:FkbH domain containing protein [Parasponia andersonii]